MSEAIRPSGYDLRGIRRLADRLADALCEAMEEHQVHPRHAAACVLEVMRLAAPRIAARLHEASPIEAVDVVAVERAQRDALRVLLLGLAASDRAEGADL